MSWDSIDSALAALQKRKEPHWENYLGFYSSWLNGYFKEPWSMLMPIDDHGFHRGDGVFEAVRIYNRAFIDLNGHLQRLENSGRQIGMVLPKSIGEITTICTELARRTQAESGLLRLFVSRGPGGFSPSPKEVVGHQLYAIITRLRSPVVGMYENGCRAMISTVPAKDAFWSQIKSCNYLQNVLMKSECEKKGFDFAISVNAEGRLSEGATENLMVITEDGELRVPRFDYTLPGTTISIVMKLANELVDSNELSGVGFSDLFVDDLIKAKEAAFVGTTLGVLPIQSIDDSVIGKGQAGPICRYLQKRLMEKMASDQNLRTPF